jgi:RNA recognition motif-containing protein
MKKIFVGNLSYSATEVELRSLFEAFGAVESVHIVTDRDSGQPRGFGFVEMPNDAEAANAITGMNGKDLQGRTLNVNEARPKTDRPAGGGGSGYGRKRW